MVNFDFWFKLGNVLAWLAAIVVFYFSSQANTASDMATLAERVAVAETRITQEMIGYSVIQSSVGERLARIENKVDCLIDKRLCR